MSVISKFVAVFLIVNFALLSTARGQAEAPGAVIDGAIKGKQLGRALALIDDLRKRVEVDFMEGFDKLIPQEVGEYRASPRAVMSDRTMTVFGARRFIKPGAAPINMSLTFGAGLGKYVASFCDDKNSLVLRNITKTKVLGRPAVLQQLPGIVHSSFTICLEGGGVQLSSESATKEQYEAFASTLGDSFYSGLVAYLNSQA